MAEIFQYEVESLDQLSAAFGWAAELVKLSLPGGPVALFVGRPKRSLEQNSKLWPMLRDISKQVQWCGEWLIPEEWKDLFVAALKKQKAVPGIDGGVVIIGGHTSKMDIETFSDLIMVIQAFGDEHDVKWTNETLHP